MDKAFLEKIQSGETETIEFKANFCDEVIETLTSMANTNGGEVFLGIDNKAKVTGVEVGKESIPKWINEIKHKTDFKIIPDVEIADIKNKKVIILSVTEYPNKPIAFKGRYYRRVKNSNHLMTIDEISNEYLKTRNRSWDMFIDEDARLQDLDLDKVNALIQRINRNRDVKIAEDPIAFLRKFDLISGEQVTHAAMLLFSLKPLFYTEIQIGLFATDIVIKKSLTIKTDLLSEVDMVMDFIMAHITKEYIITGKPERDERWQYPLSAVREFVVNAIIHRDYRSGTHSQFRVYKDKLEIWNIGKLPVNLTIEDLYSGEEKSTPRNIKVAEIFKEVGLIEKYGSGIKRAVSEIMEYDLPKPSIKVMAGGINVDIFGERVSEKGVEKGLEKGVEKGVEKLSENQMAIIALIEKDKYISKEEMAKIGNLSKKTVEYNINVLKEKGRLERIGPDKGGHWKIREK